MKVFWFVLITLSLLSFALFEASDIKGAIVCPNNDPIPVEVDLVAIFETFHIYLFGSRFVKLVVQKTSCFKDFLLGSGNRELFDQKLGNFQLTVIVF